MKKLIILLYLQAPWVVLLAQSNNLPQSFSHLTLFDLGEITWSSTHENPKVFYNSEITTIVNENVKKGSPFYSETSEMIDTRIILKTRIRDTDNKEYFIGYDDGISGDPNFSIFLLEKDSVILIKSIGGLALYIPGNGNIYSTGHANNYFSENHKYQLINDKLVEIKQPYLYVGIKTKTEGLLTIFNSKSLTNKIATLPKGSEVEILLNEGDYFLIKTSFGLTGWWKYEYGEKSVIKEIFFNGD